MSDHLNRHINRVQISSPSLTAPTGNGLMISSLSPPLSLSSGHSLVSRCPGFFLSFFFPLWMFGRFPSSSLCLSVDSIVMMPWPRCCSPPSSLHNDKNMNLLIQSKSKRVFSNNILDSTLNHPYHCFTSESTHI